MSDEKPYHGKTGKVNKINLETVESDEIQPRWENQN